MAELILFNKPFHVLCQFTDEASTRSVPPRKTLADWISIPDVYPAGRLDYDSEGLLLLTSDGSLQHSIASPSRKMPKTYWVQVEGQITPEAIVELEQGVRLKDGITRPAKARIMEAPEVWPRVPPVRHRETIPTSWLELTITEGRNRQVRRMTAAVGFPTLRLIRYRIGSWTLDGLSPGDLRRTKVHVPPATGRQRKPARSLKKKPFRRTRKP